MADTLAFGATAPASLPYTRLSRWEARQAVRTGQAADIKIYPEGARASAGAIATVHVRDGREASALALARLIAAAPELLDVLLDVLHAVTRLAALAYDVQTTDSGLIAPPEIKAACALLERLEGGAA